MNRERKLYSLEEKRLAKLLRQAALQHVKSQHALAAATLAEAKTLVKFSSRPAWGPGFEFLCQWRETVKLEHEGKVPPTAPAAWIHISQELATQLENGGDWIAYLGTRWKVEAGRIAPGKRIALGLAGALTLLTSFLILWLTIKGVINEPLGRMSLGELAKENVVGALLALGRLLGTLLMVEHGFSWLRKGITGESDEPEVTFLGSPSGGLILLS